MKTNVCYSVGDTMGKPCSNSKFMCIAGMEGMTVKTSEDSYFNEQVTSVYRNGELMAERISDLVSVDGKSTKLCFVFGYYKGIV